MILFSAHWRKVFTIIRRPGAVFGYDGHALDVTPQAASLWLISIELCAIRELTA